MGTQPETTEWPMKMKTLETLNMHVEDCIAPEYHNYHKQEGNFRFVMACNREDSRESRRNFLRNFRESEQVYASRIFGLYKEFIREVSRMNSADCFACSIDINVRRTYLDI